MKYDVYTEPVGDPLWGDALTNPLLIDNIWGGDIPYDHRGQKQQCTGLKLSVEYKQRFIVIFIWGGLCD